METSNADIVIVGGGGIGSAVAYFLSTLSDQNISILVCERDQTYQFASTTLAAGGIRQMFSTPENILMSQFGFEFVKAAADLLAIDGDRPEMGLKLEHYLRLLPEESRTQVEEQVELQRSLGARPTILSPGELHKMFPWMNVEDVGLAVIGGGGEGVYDPYALLQAFRRKSIAQGVKYLQAEVAGFEKDRAGQVSGVKLADGSVIDCGRVVNAAGPRAGFVAEMAGLELPVIPVKSHTFSFKAANPPLDCPVVLDKVQPMNFKPEGDLFLAAWGARNPLKSNDDFDVEYELFEEEIWPGLAHRVPQFEAIKMSRAWVGHLEINTFDANPILGPHPECSNFIFANGFSGHGVQHLPAAGRGIAELILFEEYRSLDLTRFAYDRLRTGVRVREIV